MDICALLSAFFGLWYIIFVGMNGGFKSSILVLGLLCLVFFSYGQQNAPRMSVNDYVQKYKDIAVRKMKEHGIPASITLAQGLLESGNGNSELAVNANNHFGIKCHETWTGPVYHMDDDAANECFRKYSNPEESFEDHSVFLMTRSRYAFLFQYEVTDYSSWAHGLKKAGYATNPNYARLLIKLIEENRLYEYDKEQVKVEEPVVFDLKNLPIEYSQMKDQAVVDVIDLGKFQRQVSVNNGVKYIIARKGDSFERIAEDLGVMPWQLIRYNELSRGDKLSEGQILYLQPKKRKGSAEYHVVKAGESLYSISQLYGIKTKHLLKKNRMKAGMHVYPGLRLWLRKTKPDLFTV